MAALNFSLSDAQNSLQETVQRFCSARWPLDFLRRVEFETEDRFDAKTFSELADMGLLGLAIPGKYGGEDASWLDRVVVYEALGRGLFLSPHFVSSIASVSLLVNGATIAACEDLFPRVASGEAIVTYAVCGRSDSDMASSHIRVDGELLTGQLRAVPYAATATHFVIAVANDDDTFDLMLVEHHEALKCDQLLTMAGAPLYDVDLRSVPARTVSCVPIGRSDLERSLTWCNLLIAAEALGGAKSALEIAVAYASKRVAFGQHIGSFQALQHKLADMATRIEVANVAVYYAARVADLDEKEQSLAPCALAILVASDTYGFVARNAVQVYGGAGVMTDSDVSIHFRRSRMLAADLGDRRALEKNIASDLLSDQAPGIPRDVFCGAGSGLGLADALEGISGAAEEQQELRRELRNYFGSIMTSDIKRQIVASKGDYSQTLYQELADSGYLGLGIPSEYGGRGLGYTQLGIFEEEAMFAGMPHGIMSILANTTHFAANLLIRIGNETQRRAFLPGIMSGEYRFCMGLTEPEAGSDLGGVQSFADESNGGFRLNGQKVFNSAHVCTHMMTVVRSDKDLAKHKGISLLVVDLRVAGITILPLYTIRGWRRNLVIFEDTTVPRENLVAEKNDGWYALMSVIDLERSGVMTSAERWRVFQEILRYLSEQKNGPGRTIESERDVAILSSLYRDSLLGWLLSRRVLWMQDRHEDVTALGSFQKLFNSEACETFVLSAMELLGGVVRTEGSSGSGETRQLGSVLADLYKDCRNTQISGGSSEIQRNIIARRVLGLPSS